MNRPNLLVCGFLFFISLNTFCQSPVNKIEAVLEQKFKTVVNRCHDPKGYLFVLLNVFNIEDKKEGNVYLVEGDYTFQCGKDTFYNKFKAALKKYEDDFIVTEIKTTNSKNFNDYWVVFPKIPGPSTPEKSKKSIGY